MVKNVESNLWKHYKITEFTEENTRIRKSDNSRQCRTCERQRCRDYYWERGGKAKRYNRHLAKGVSDGI